MAPTSGPADSISSTGTETSSALPTAPQTPQAESSPETQPTPEEEYPGVQLSDKFPEIAVANASENPKQGKHTLEIEDLLIEFDGYTPISISRSNGRRVKMTTHHPGEYRGYGVGKAELLGKGKEAMYIEFGGISATCCSQVFLIDLSGREPKVVFGSEDYGRFKWGAEVFDAEGDGILEIAMFDSCFRYFMDDCGSCSPEPKAVFKYEGRSGEYVPAKGIRQDFDITYLNRNEEWVKREHDLGDGNRDVRYRWTLNQVVVAKLWLGEEEEAWKFFDLYTVQQKEETRTAMRETLKECPYYQAIRKLP